MKKFYVIGIALLAMFAFSAVAASSASAEGPWWIILLCVEKTGTGLFTDSECKTEEPAGKGNFELELHKLVWPEEEALTTENDEVPFVLDSEEGNILCDKMKGEEGKLIGNNPGMDLVKLIFWECHVELLPNCLAENLAETTEMKGGVIDTEPAFSVLVYPDPENTSLAMDAFFTDSTTSDLFAEFTLKGTEPACLGNNGLVVDVSATGTEVTEVGETGHKVLVDKKCGVLGELGLLNANKVFEEALNGEELLLGALDTEAGVEEAVILNANVGLIVCSLSAFNLVAHELGIAKIDLVNKNEFGWEN